MKVQPASKVVSSGGVAVAENPRPVSPVPAPAKEPKVKVPRKKRSDFAGPDGWVQWCEHQKQRVLRRVEKMQAKAQLWEAKKAGEHLDQEAKKLRRIEKLSKVLAALKAELAVAGIAVPA